MTIKNKKGLVMNQKVLLVSLSIIGILILLYIGFGAQASLLFETRQINIISSDSSSSTCEIAGKESVEIPLTAGQKFKIEINKPSEQEAFFGLIENRISSIAGISPCVYNGSTSRFRGCLREKFKENLGKQLILIDATYENKNLNFYGLCDLTERSCEMTAPLGVEKLPVGDARVIPSSVKIFYKLGGYSEKDFISPSTSEEQEVAEIISEIEESQNPTSSESPLEDNSNIKKPFKFFEWLSAQWKKIIGWFHR
jgi:hypothetical protein